MIYFYPNRPLLYTVEHPDILRFSYDPNYVAEIKKNGDRLCLQKENDKFIFMNRHKELLKRYTPIPEVLDELHSLNIPNNSQLDGELMHNHTKATKHQLYFYDVYLWGGECNRDSFRFRRAFLENLFANKKFSHLELAKQYANEDFQKLYYSVIGSLENEGLVIKNLNGKLIFNTGKSNDVDWQIKIRKENKNYKF